MPKLFRLFLYNWRSSQYDYKIYDGPGLLCPKLSTTQGFVWLSSCCGFLLVLTKTHHINETAQGKFITSLQRQTERKLYKESETVYLPDKNCSISLCVVLWKTQNEGHINATVAHVTHQGKQTSSCQYSGLVLIENFKNQAKEYPTLCEHHQGSTKTNSRSFYSMGDSLAVLLFWFKEYSSINATLTISCTKCSVVPICPCTFFLLCGWGNSLLGHTCSTYLKMSTLGTNITLQYLEWFKALHLLSVANVLSFSVPKNECFTLQLMKNKTMLAGYSGKGAYSLNQLQFVCTVTIKSTNIAELGNTLQFSIKGSRGYNKSFSPDTWTNKTSKYRCPALRFLFTGGINNLGFHGVATNFSHVCPGSAKCFQNSVEHVLDPNTEFFVTFTLNSPFYGFSMHLLLHEALIASNWLDMTVSRAHKKATFGPNMCLECVFPSEKLQVRVEFVQTLQMKQRNLFSSAWGSFVSLEPPWAVHISVSEIQLEH